MPFAQDPLDAEVLDAPQLDAQASLAMAASALSGEPAAEVLEAIGERESPSELATWALTRGFHVKVHAGADVAVDERVREGGGLVADAPANEDLRVAMEARHPFVVPGDEGWIVVVGIEEDKLRVLDPSQGVERVLPVEHLALSQADSAGIELGPPNRAEG